MYDDEKERWGYGKPRIEDSSRTYKLKRPRSNDSSIHEQLHKSVLQQDRKSSQQREEALQNQKRSLNSSVLENAGITNGQRTNSDKYLAIKLTKEFDSAVQSIDSISSFNGMVDKNQVQAILVKLMLLKSPDLIVSEFTEVENSQAFESIWLRIADWRSADDSLVPIEQVRYFFLNMHYLWGEWLSRMKLMAKENKPDKKNMTPGIEKVKMLHSVPIVNINVRANKKLGYQNNDTQINILSARFAVSDLAQRSGRSGTPTITSNRETMNDRKCRSPQPESNNNNRSTFGAQSDYECRKLVNDFNLLLVNRKMLRKVISSGE